MTPDTPGTWRVSDGSAVDFPDARRSWAEIGHPFLVALAGTFGGLVSYKDFAEEVQSGAGIRTRVLLTNWIGKLLGDIARQAMANGEPSLTSLVVRQNGTIGPGYAEVYEQRGLAVPADLEQAAANDRFECYRNFGADIPLDGKPMLTPQVVATRSRQRRAAPAPPRQVCPSCFRHLPYSGVCDMCSDA